MTVTLSTIVYPIYSTLSNVFEKIDKEFGESQYSIPEEDITAGNNVSVFGNYFVNNSPMMVGITISKDILGNDISKVRTYNARRDVNKLINDSNILYISENKKDTRKRFRICGIQVPLDETKFGVIRSISEIGEKVKTQFSIPKDTEGNKLSEGQQEFFITTEIYQEL